MKNILKNYFQKINRNYQSEYLFKKEYFYLKTSKSILDIGCGEGNFLTLNPKKIIGLDHNKKSIEICIEKGLQAKLGDVTKIPFQKNSFDGVHCSHVIEHLYPEDAFKMLNEIGRVLKKGGIFVISTPILWEGFYDDFTHIKPYSHKSIERYLCRDGAEKSYGDVKSKYKKIAFYWRYRTIYFPFKVGNLISNYLYTHGVHSYRKDAFTLVLEKKC